MAFLRFALASALAFFSTTLAAPVQSFDEVAAKASHARQNGRLDEAISFYRQGVRLRPWWDEGWWHLGSLLYDKDRYTEARDAFRRYVALDPKSGPAHAMLGLCLYQTRDYEMALVHLKRGQGLGFGGEKIERVALYHIALLLTRYEDYEKALEILVGFTKKEDNPLMIEAAGIAALRKPLLPSELPPRDREIVLLAGRAVSDAGGYRVAEAEQVFQELLAKYPNAPNVHYIYGAFLLQGNPPEAVRHFERELQISPGHVPALVQLAFEFQKRGEFEKGLGHAREAVKNAPNSAVARNILGRLLLDLDQLEPGISELERSRELAPESPQTRFALATAYARAGRSEEAAREQEEFLRLRKMADEAGRVR